MKPEAIRLSSSSTKTKMGTKSLLSVISAASLSFCVSCGCDSQCYNGNYQNVTSYKVEAGSYTSKGIGLDGSKNPDYVLDADEVEWQVDGLEGCLNDNFKEDPIISEQEASHEYDEDGVARGGWCVERDFSKGVQIKRDCITVKVPDDLYTSMDGKRLLFPCDVNPQLCKDKGFEDATKETCNCRATVQDGNYVITEPRLEVFRAELARIVTGCNNPWVITQIKGCLINPHFSLD